MRKFAFSSIALLLLLNAASAQKISASFPDSILKQPFTGHVLLYLSKTNKEPKSGTAGLDIFPCADLYAKNVKPGTAVMFDDKATSFPVPLSDLERGQYYIQAVWDCNLGGRSIGESPGNLYSTARKINLTKDFGKVYHIIATRTVAGPIFKETQYVKELKVPSALLSRFYGRPFTLNAAVRLPKDYHTQPQRKFPVLFTVFGYGGDYHGFSGAEKAAPLVDTTSFITVYLDGNCPLGHSVYANSDNNGPWGDALTTELIPMLEKQYRCNGAKLLTGHSSGGWTVLWLQTHYPKVFDGCWSSSPDPVDFRSFQRVNLYQHENMFYGKDSTLNQTGTIAGFFPWFSMKSICQMEHVIYRGEQMHSFDAVFSRKGRDGNPERICNYKTGEVDTTVFAHWKNYDISLYLRSNWNQIKPDLDGKVRVTVGRQDNFLLNYAVMLLEGEMKKLDSSFVFTYYPGDHFTVASEQFQKDGAEFLERKYQEWQTRHM